MSKYIYPYSSIFLVVLGLTLTLFPASCLAFSYPNKPCDAGDGFFLFSPSYEGWHIYFENEKQKNICYHVDREDDFVSGIPEYDFDEHWIFIKVKIYEPKKTVDRRTNRIAHFLFDKETREMSGPLTEKEFFESPAVVDKNFDWKRADQKDTRGHVWVLLIILFVSFAIYILPVVLLVILVKWCIEMFICAKTSETKTADIEQNRK